MNTWLRKVNFLYMCSAEDPVSEEYSVRTLKEQTAYYFQTTKCIFKNFYFFFIFIFYLLKYS